MGLRTGDLKFCVERTLEIDSYKSKMGEDKDIVTISFAVIVTPPRAGFAFKMSFPDPTNSNECEDTICKLCLLK